MGKSIRKNFLFHCLLNISSVIFPLITFPYVSRILLPDGMGKVSFATSLIAYFNLFAQLGIPTYGIRACARVRDDREALTRTVHELMMINLATTAVSFFALLAAVTFIPRLHEEKALYLIVSSSMFFTAIGMEWLYQAMEQYSYITLRSIAFKFLGLIAMFLFIHEKEDYIWYGAISVFANSAAAIINFFYAKKFISFKPMGKYCLRRHWKAVAVFFAMVCATTIYTNLDSVMLGFIRNESDVGLYNSAVKIKSVLCGIVSSLGAVMLPRVSSYIEQGKNEEFWFAAKRSLNFVVLLSAPLCLFFMIFARPSIYLLSGGAFELSILPMRIIMPTLILIGITNILGFQILVPLLKEKTVMFSTIAGAIVNLIANFLLIPRFGVIGAAVGTVFAEVLVLIVQFTALKKNMSEAFRSIKYSKILFALCAACLAGSWPLWSGMSNFMTLVVSTVLFFGVYAAVLFLAKEPFVTEISGQMIAKIKSRMKKN